MSLPKGMLDVANDRDTPFLLFQSHPDDFAKHMVDGEKNIDVENKILRAFFHPSNIKKISECIVKLVYTKSRGEYMIDNQRESDIQMIMELYARDYCYNSKKSMKEQLYNLNKTVCDKISTQILSDIKMEDAYKERAFGQLQPIDRPINVSNAGTKTLPSVSKFFL